MGQLEISNKRNPAFGVKRIMSKADFNVIFDEVKSKLATEFNEYGDIEPIIAFSTISTSGAILQISTIPAFNFLNQPNAGKLVNDVTDNMLQDANIDICIFMHQAFSLALENEDTDIEQELSKYNSIKDHPNAQEGIFVSIKSKELEAFTIFNFINKNTSKSCDFSSKLTFSNSIVNILEKLNK